MLVAALAGAGASTAAGTASTGQDALIAEVSTWRWTVDQILYQERPARPTSRAGHKSAPRPDALGPRIEKRKQPQMLHHRMNSPLAAATRASDGQQGSAA